MPLIDLKSMSHQQLEEEARQWTLEPTNYKNEQELRKAIEDQRRMRGSNHPIDQADVDSGMAAHPDVPGRLETGPRSVGEKDQKPRKAVADLKDKDIVQSKEHATVTRPTPGEPENTNQKAEKANKEMEAQDNSTETQDTNKTDNPGAELKPRGKTQEILDKKNQ